MIEEKFPTINLEGNAKEIGFQHGLLLKERINDLIDFYHKSSNLPENLILNLAKNYKAKIEEFHPPYNEEIDEIARGAEVNPLWIHVINARTEIMSFLNDGCTSNFFSKTGILAQNWDCS